MKLKVLFLAYFFPPIAAAGSIRALRFANLLPNFDIDLTVVTVSRPDNPWVSFSNEQINPLVNVVKAPEIPLASFARFLHGACCRVLGMSGVKLDFNYFEDILIPDAQIGWLCLPKAIRLAKSSDVILATCSPFSSAVLAIVAGAIVRRPVVLDFRDAWSTNPVTRRSKLNEFLTKCVERWCLKYCNHLILNTEATLNEYRSLYPDCAAKMSCIPNGYDRLNLPLPEDIQSDELLIVHVGSFYGGRDPKALLEALAELSLPKIRFVQVGELWDGTSAFQGKVRITETGVVSREKALQWMRKASLLYLNWKTTSGNQLNFVSAKTYDYLATGRPILAHISEGEDLRILRQYAGTLYYAPPNNIEALKKVIKQAVVASSEDQNFIVTDSFKTNYNPTQLSSLLAELLRKVARKKKGI